MNVLAVGTTSMIGQLSRNGRRQPTLQSREPEGGAWIYFDFIKGTIYQNSGSLLASLTTESPFFSRQAGSGPLVGNSRFSD